MNLLRKTLDSRWFPTLAKPLLIQALVAGIGVALHYLGITSFVPAQVNMAASIIAGLVLGAIVQKPPKPTVQLQVPPSTMAKALADVMAQYVQTAVDSNPDLIRQFGLQLLKSVEQQANPIAALRDAYAPGAPSTSPPEGEAAGFVG